jgi:F-type H+-transporting ATPase subunit b
MDKLGINLQAFLSQLVIFLVVFFALSKLVYPKFLEMLDERRKKIQEGVEKSDAIDKELASIEKVKSQEIIKSQQETSVIIKQAREEAESIKKSVLDEANQQARQIIIEAEKEIEKKKQESIKEFSNSAVELAMLAVKNIIKTDTINIDQNKILLDSMEEFKRTYQSGK